MSLEVVKFTGQVSAYDATLKTLTITDDAGYDDSIAELFASSNVAVGSFVYVYGHVWKRFTHKFKVTSIDATNLVLKYSGNDFNNDSSPLALDLDVYPEQLVNYDILPVVELMERLGSTVPVEGTRSALITDISYNSSTGYVDVSFNYSTYAGMELTLITGKYVYLSNYSGWNGFYKIEATTDSNPTWVVSLSPFDNISLSASMDKSSSFTTEALQLAEVPLLKDRIIKRAISIAESKLGRPIRAKVIEDVSDVFVRTYYLKQSNVYEFINIENEGVEVDTDYYVVDTDDGVVHNTFEYLRNRRKLYFSYVSGYDESTLPDWLKACLLDLCHLLFQFNKGFVGGNSHSDGIFNMGFKQTANTSSNYETTDTYIRIEKELLQHRSNIIGYFGGDD